MWQLEHDNIVRYIGTDLSDRFLFILLEFVPGGSVASMLQQFGPFSDTLIRRFSLHILQGTLYASFFQFYAFAVHTAVKCADSNANIETHGSYMPSMLI